MKIGTRLAGGFAAILLLSTTMSVIGIRQLQIVAQGTTEVLQQPLAKERLISDWYRNVTGGVLRTKAIAKSNEASMAAVFAEDATLSTKTSDELNKKIVPLLETAEERNLYLRIVEQRKRFVAAREQITQLKESGNANEASKVFEQIFLPTASTYQGLMRELVELQRASMDADAKTIVSNAGSSRNILLGLSVLAFAVGVAGAWWLTAGITGPLRQACVVARRVASGNLNGKIVVVGNDENAELLRALRDMNDELLKMVGEIRDGAAEISATTVQIASGNQDLSARTEDQASALEETASSMEQITSAVQQNAGNADDANRLADAASTVARNGGIVFQQVVGTMSAISESSRKIAEIVGVIDGIAFQTNILALNAAVEAARAGEHGWGFAVVASEVRTLAQRSASAAREVKELIDESGANVDAGKLLVAHAGKTMEEIVNSVDRVKTIIAEIRLASNEQAEGIRQVSRAIGKMDVVTQKNAALVEIAARDAQLVHQRAAQLDGAVRMFVLA